VLLDCGAFANSGPATAAIALQVLAGPYRTPHLAFESLAVYTNKGIHRLVPARRPDRWRTSPSNRRST